MDTGSPPIKPETKLGKSGCGCFLWMMGAGLLLVVCLVIYYDRSQKAAEFHRMNRLMAKDLQLAIANYKVDHNHFPITGMTKSTTDLVFRTRGALLQALLAENVAGLNPEEIRYIDLPMAQSGKRGLWHNSDELVLSDSYGEPFYLVLDTTADGKIANPEFGADLSDADYAEYCQKHPPPAELEADVHVYSSGKDRDPKTWHDNIRTWR